MERCDWLETISDKIRRGEPVGIREAMAAIEYQHRRQAYLKQNVWWRRALRWLTYNNQVERQP